MPTVFVGCAHMIMEEAGLISKVLYAILQWALCPGNTTSCVLLCPAVDKGQAIDLVVDIDLA